MVRIPQVRVVEAYPLKMKNIARMLAKAAIPRTKFCTHNTHDKNVVDGKVDAIEGDIGASNNEFGRESVFACVALLRLHARVCQLPSPS